MFNAVLTQPQVRSAAVQRQRFRGADNNFIFTAGHRQLFFRKQGHRVVLSLNFDVPGWQRA